MKITGTLIKNFFHCKRQAYLYYYGLNFRNELVRLGEIMHEEQNAEEIIFEKIKVDDIKGNLLIEYKKTSANLKGTKFQVLHYLKYFKEKGLRLKGVIKDLTFGDEYIIKLSKEDEQNLKEVVKKIEEVMAGEMPPRLKLKKNCKGCSFFDYCWTK